MASHVLFSPVTFDRYDADQTLPARFSRMLDQFGLEQFAGKNVAIKMHLGRGIGYTTIHPLFVKTLCDKLKSFKARPFVTDQIIEGARNRGYTEDFLGVPIVAVCGHFGKYFYPRQVAYKTFENVDIGGHINDADAMIVLSHVKGHGACGYGGACKNIAMGCVTDRTRRQIHHLEGGILWNEELCIRCDRCISGCNHSANRFTDEGKYEIFFHHCTFCQHCVKVCPTGAIQMDGNSFQDFQTGMALCTDEVLSTFEPGMVSYINFLTNITALCDCWGLSTPALVPDIGVMASKDIVAIERASIDKIKIENLLMDGIPQGSDMSGEGHLFERLHGKNPFIQLDELEKRGLGGQEYELSTIM